MTKTKHQLVGKNLVAHHKNCGCDFLRTVKHAPWITYDMMDGVVTCDRCRDSQFLPTPSVRINWWSRDVFLDHDAIAGDLNRFKEKHENCQVTELTRYILTTKFDTKNMVHEPVCLRLPKPSVN